MSWESTNVSLRDLTPCTKNAQIAYSRVPRSLLNNMQVKETHIVSDRTNTRAHQGHAPSMYTLYIYGSPTFTPYNGQGEMVYTVLLQVDWRTGEVASKEFFYEGGAPSAFVNKLPDSIAPCGDDTFAADKVNEYLTRDHARVADTRNLNPYIKEGAWVHFGTSVVPGAGNKVEWAQITSNPSKTGRAMTSLLVDGKEVKPKRGWRSKVQAVAPTQSRRVFAASRSQDAAYLKLWLERKPAGD